MRRLSMLISFLLCLLLVPAYGWAQEGDGTDGNAENVEIQDDQVVEDANVEADSEVQEVKLPRTLQDNFKGWFFGGEVLVGTAQYYDGDIGGGRDAYDEDAEWLFGGTLNVAFGYLWGSEVFIGPMISASAGVPEIISTDIRIKFVVPININNALALELGWGVAWVPVFETDKPVVIKRDRKKDESDHWLDFVERMYLPVKIGYEHVFDNGFVLGASLEARINFGQKQILFYQNEVSDGGVHMFNKKGEEEIYDGVKEEVSLYYGMITAGIHLGYKF